MVQRKSSRTPGKGEKMYAGGSKNFDERTGKYKKDSSPGSGRRKPSKGRTPDSSEKVKGDAPPKMSMKERMAKLREMRGKKAPAKKAPAKKAPAKKASAKSDKMSALKARLEKAKKAKIKKPTARKKR